MKINKSLYFIIFFFFVLYASVSLVNHYNFRTACWDLGLFNNALYDYAHFHWNTPTLLPNPDIKNSLADHFSLLIIFFSPLYWIFGSWTLLIVQILGILWGGIGIYKLVNRITQNDKLAVLASIFFYSLWGIYSALSFDYHDNVMAAMFVPWFMYYAIYKRWGWAVFYYILILICKENMAFWMGFICLGMLVHFWKDKKQVLVFAGLGAFALIYFVTVVKVIIPAMGVNYVHFNYDALGKNFGEALVTIVSKPQYVFTLLLEDHTKNPDAYGIKSELHFVVLLSGGLALLFRPQFLIMLIPIYAQKLFNNDFGKWGVNGHYSIEFVPILTIALFMWINDFSEKWKLIAASFFLAVGMATSISLLDHRVSKWYAPDYFRFYQKPHYVREYDVKKVYKALKLVPDNASVSAESMLVPHLAFRKKIYQYPDIKDANYIVLLKADQNSFPFNHEDFLKKIQELKDSHQWGTLFEDDTVLILKRINP